MSTAEDLRRQVAIQDALLTHRAERSFRAYVEQAWPILEPATPFLPNWHIDLIAEHLFKGTPITCANACCETPAPWRSSLTSFTPTRCHSSARA